METNHRNETLHRVSPAQWARSVFISLLPVFACFLGGAGTKWAEGVIVLLLGAFLIFQPPRRSLGWLINAIFIAFALCALASYLPQSWWSAPAWRIKAVKDFGITLPASVTPQPWLTAGCVASLIAALVWLYRVSAQELELRIARFQLRLFAGGMVMIAAISILLYFAHNRLPFWPNDEGFGPFNNANYNADLFGMTSVLIVAAAQDDIRRRRLRWLFWTIGLIVLIAAIVLNGSRAGVIILLASIAVWIGIIAMCVGSAARIALPISILLFIASIALMFAGPGSERFQRFFGTDGGWHWQSPISMGAMTLISSSPLSGIGLGNFDPVIKLASDSSPDHASDLFSNNDWTRLVIELGVVAGVVCVIGVALLIARAWPLRMGTNQRFRLAALIGVFILAIRALTDLSAHQPGMAYTGLFLLGLCLHRPTQLRCSKILIPWVFRIIGLLLLIAGLSWVIAWRTLALQPGVIGVRNAKQLAAVASRGRNFAEAVDLLTRGLSWAPLDGELYLLRGRTELTRQPSSPQLALADFRRASFLEPTSYSIPLEEGFAWLPLRTDLAASAWAEALHRAGHERPGAFRSIIAGASMRNPTARATIEKLAFNDPGLALEYLSQVPATSFHDALTKFVESDPDLTKLGSKEKKELFHLWRERGGLSSLVETIDRHPQWLPLAWRAVASSRAASGDYCGACGLMQQFGSDAVFPAPEANQSSEELQTRIHQGTNNFSAGFSLYRQQMDRGQIDDALATARYFAAKEQAPAYFHLLEAQALAAKQDWPESWKAWVAFEKAKGAKP